MNNNIDSIYNINSIYNITMFVSDCVWLEPIDSYTLGSTRWQWYT